MEKMISRISFLAFFLVIIFGVGMYSQAKAAPNFSDDNNCEVESYWEPLESPWHKSGGQLFSLFSRWRADSSSQMWSSWDEKYCTTGPNDGDKCTASAYFTKMFAEQIDSAPNPCSIGRSLLTSPPNRLDKTGPSCGPPESWIGRGTASDPFKPSGATDSQSGIKDIGTCVVQPGKMNCVAAVTDNVDNLTNCTSPDLKGPSPALDTTPPVCGTWSSFDNNGNITLSGSTDSGVGLDSNNPTSCSNVPVGSTCSLTIKDNGGLATTCVSPPRPGTFTCSARDIQVTAGSSTVFTVLDETTSPPNSGSYTWSIDAGSPLSGSGTSFETKPAGHVLTSVLRTATVKDSAGKAASCSVKVISNNPPCTTDIAGLAISSNVPTTWILTGPVTKTQDTPATQAAYYQLPAGTYTLVASEAPGTPSYSPSQTQTFTVPPSSSCNPGISGQFAINYSGKPNPSTEDGTITVNSNEATTWTLYGPTGVKVASQDTPSKSVTYTNMAKGILYSVAANKLDGMIEPNPKIEPASGILDKSLTFNLNYQPDGICVFDFYITTGINPIFEGATTTMKGWYSKTGCSGSWISNVSCGGTTWQPQRPDISAPISCHTDSMKSDLNYEIFKGLKAGITKVTALYSNKTDEGSITVLAGNSPNFSCSPIPRVFYSPLTGATFEGNQITCTSLNGFAGTINFNRGDVSPDFLYPNASPYGPEMTLGSGETKTGSFVLWANKVPIGKFGYYQQVNIKAYSYVNNNGNANIEHQYPLDVYWRGSEDLIANLQAIPNSSNQAFVSTLVGTAGGGIDPCDENCPPPPTLNYTFWADCPAAKNIPPNQVLSVQQAENLCRAHIAKFDDRTELYITTNYKYEKNSSPLLIVERGSKTARAMAEVQIVPDAAKLSVSLTPKPALGEADLNVDLEAAIQNAGIGTISYNFFKDCSADKYSGTDVDVAKSKCGDFIETKNSASLTAISKTIYPVGSFTPLVIAKQNGMSARANATVNVTPSTLGKECTLTATPKFITKGMESNLTWTCGGDPSVNSCKILVKNNPGNVIGTGTSGSKKVSPAETTQYNLSCNNDKINIPATVFVQNLEETPPQ